MGDSMASLASPPRSFLGFVLELMAGVACSPWNFALGNQRSHRSIRQVVELPTQSLDTNYLLGPLVRVGISTVVNSNPETVTKILQPRSCFIRAPDYQAARFRPGVDNILSIRDEDAHKVLKAKTSAGVSVITRSFLLSWHANQGS